ncbi:MAG: hypothetical protein GWP03_07030 [Proteobacteria bacterium]|nr:hypothetical protein [Pseudomonadota bacterium]
MFYWLNSIEAGVRIPINNRMLDVGFGYGWGNVNSSSNLEARFPDTLVNSITVNLAYLGVANIRKFYLYLSCLKLKKITEGLEFNYCQAYGEECYYPYVYPNLIVNVRRDLIGGGGYIKFCNTRKNKRKFRFDPYFMIRISGSYEIHSTSPYSGLWDKKLTIWYTGIYGGFNFNIGGKR